MASELWLPWSDSQGRSGSVLSPLGGDGTTVELAGKEEVKREVEALLESDKELLKRLAD